MLCIFFSSRFFSRTADLSSGVDVAHGTRQVCRPTEKTPETKTMRHNFVLFTFMQTIETCTYISLVYRLTAINQILLAG